MKPSQFLSLAAAAAAVVNADDSLDTFTKKRIVDLAQFPDPSWFKKIDTWLSTQKDDGTWPDVNYLSGCPAQRANWPIQEHWNRVITFGAAWSNANPLISSSGTFQDNLLKAIQKGLDYWFDNDYTPADCVGEGGVAGFNCPCGTPGLWNTNWFDQGILIPQLVSTACLLVKNATLSESQRAGCIRIPKRAYDLRDGTFGTGGRMTGANMVQVMQNSVSLALFTDNSTILADAMTRAMAVMTFTDDAGVDGIHRDGTFLQHTGILYNGNYGKDLLNAFIQLEGEAIGTPFAANDDTRAALAALIQGDEWMIYTDHANGVEHWDFNAIGRFVAFPTPDLQASADINFNVTKLANAVADFSGPFSVSDTIRRLQSNGTEHLVGNKGFWASDYMVHRRGHYTLANKMLSTRSANSESANGANPFGYHMGQGTLYSYVEGNEYKDIMGAWDWNLVPGTTVLLDHPTLQIDKVKYTGKTEFVGVVSDGKVGTSVEDYVDPLDGTLSFRKSWFFVEDGVVVITTDIKKSAAAGDAPVITVLDNRAASQPKALVQHGAIARPNEDHIPTDTLYYGNNGYLAYDTPFSLTISLGQQTGNWSAISTSTAGATSVDIFSAYTTIKEDKFTYAFFPGIPPQRLDKELEKPTYTPIIEKGITGVHGQGRLSLAFWPGGATSVTIDLVELGWSTKKGSLTFTSNQPAIYLLSVKCKDKSSSSFRLSVTLADPTQKLTTASFSIKFNGQSVKARELPRRSEGLETRDDGSVGFGVRLPGGGLAGSSINREIFLQLN